MSFADLLLFAGGGEFHDFDLAGIFKVGDWRVVEGEVAVFSDAQAAEVDGRLGEQAFVAVAFVQREQGVACQVVEGLGFGFGFDAFFHVALEAGAVARRQSEIFVHMEKLDSGPVHRFGFDQAGEKEDLGVARGQNEPGRWLFV